MHTFTLRPAIAAIGLGFAIALTWISVPPAAAMQCTYPSTISHDYGGFCLQCSSGEEATVDSVQICGEGTGGITGPGCVTIPVNAKLRPGQCTDGPYVDFAAVGPGTASSRVTWYVSGCTSGAVSGGSKTDICEGPTPTPATPTPTPPPTPTPTPEPTPTPTPGPKQCSECVDINTPNARCVTRQAPWYESCSDSCNANLCTPPPTPTPTPPNKTCSVCEDFGPNGYCKDIQIPWNQACPPACNLSQCKIVPTPTPTPPATPTPAPKKCYVCEDFGPSGYCKEYPVDWNKECPTTCNLSQCKTTPTPTPTPTPPPQPKCVYDTVKGMYTACAVGGTGPSCNEVWDCPMPTTPPPTSTPKPLKCTPTGQCSEYGTGKSCSSAADCETVRCVDSAPYDYVYDACVVCDAAAFPLCNTVNDCLRPGCVVKNGGYQCVPGGMGPSCAQDSDCRCEGPSCGSCVNDQCVIGAHGGKPCTDSSACVDTQTYCVPGQPLCLTRAHGGTGIPCSSNSICDVCPPGTHRCPVTGQCVPDGQPCPTPTPTMTPTATPVTACPNGATNPPRCDQCPAGKVYHNGQCVTQVCGNNIVEGTEQCDAGSKNNDGCSGCNDKCELVVVTEQTCKNFLDCKACGCVEKVALKADSNEEIKIAGDFQPVRYQIRVQNKSNYDPTEILLTDSIQAKQTFMDNKAGYIETPFSTQGYMEYGDKARIVENRNVDGTKVEVWDQFTSSWKSNVGDTVAFLPGGNIGGTSQPPRETRPALRIRNIKHAPNAAGPYSTLVLEYTARARTSFAGHELGKLNNGTDTQFVQIVNEASTTTNNDIYGLIVSKSFVGTGNSGSVYFTGDVDSSDVNKIGGAVGSDQDYFNVSGVFLGAIRNITSYLSTFFGFSSGTDYTEQIGQGTSGVIRGANQGSSSIVSSEDDFGRNLGKRPDGARVYTATNGLTIANSFQVRERSTVIVSQGDLRISGNITSAPGTNGAVAFVVENGNVIIDGNVSELRATIVAKNGQVIHPVGQPKSPVKLVITGSIYGSIARLLENRTYVGDPSKDADKGAAVAVRYDASILTSPFPGFREAIGDAIFSSVAR